MPFRKFFWHSDKELRTLVVVLRSKRSAKRLLAMVRREIRARA